MKSLYLVLIIQLHFLSQVCGQLPQLFRVIVGQFVKQESKLIIKELATSSILLEQTISKTSANQYKNLLDSRGSNTYSSYRELSTDFPQFTSHGQDEEMRESLRKAIAAQEKVHDWSTLFKEIDNKQKVEFWAGKTYTKTKPILTKKLTGITVAAAIPSTEKSFKRVFKHFPNSLELSITVRNYWGAKNTKDSLLRRIFSLTDLLKTIQESQNELIVIGHNENGNLILPSGEKININLLDSIKGNLKIVFLSCRAHYHTKSPAAWYNLTFSETFKIVEKINKQMMKETDNRDSMWFSSVQTAVKDLNISKKNRFALKLVKIGAGIAGSMYLVEFISKLLSAEILQTENLYCTARIFKK